MAPTTTATVTASSTGRVASPTRSAALACDDVHKVFDDGTWAVDGVSLTVQQHEIVAIVGASGCGKSTLLRMAAGLEHPTQGRVHTDVDEVGVVFQDATLLPWRTVRRNIELLPELDGTRREVREAVDDTIDLVGLREFERHRPHQLSGGMRMRVALGRALAVSPDLFLLDEPFGALDEITRKRLNDELLRLRAERPFAALLVTHSVPEAVYLAHRVVVMSPRPGRVTEDFVVPYDFPRDQGIRFEEPFTALCRDVEAALDHDGPARSPAS